MGTPRTTFTNNGTSFVPQGVFRSGYAQQCASGVTDTLLFCVGETESNVYSLTVYDTAQPAFVVLVHEAPRFFDVGSAGSGGVVFTAYQPGMLTVGVGTVLYAVDVTSPEDPKITLAYPLDVTQIKGGKCSGEHIAVHVVERDGVQENVYVYRFVDSILMNVGEIPMNNATSWDIKGGVFAAVYPTKAQSHFYVASIGDTITNVATYAVRNSETYDFYLLSLLEDRIIAVLQCSLGGCSTFDVRLLDARDGHSLAWTQMYSNTDMSRYARTANMVIVEGYLYITFGLGQTSDMSLIVVSTADWKQTFSYNFEANFHITFTQSNPPAKNNSQGLPVEPTPFTVVAIPGEYGVTTKGENASDVAHTFANGGSSFVTQGVFRSGYAQQCASGVTDTLVFCVGETESDVYSLTVYDTAQPAFVVLVHDAPRYFDVGAGSGGMVFTAYQPGMLLVVVGTVLYAVDVSSLDDLKITLVVHLNVSQIMRVKCSEHIAVHVVESDGVQENVYVYRFVGSILKNVGHIPMNGERP